MVSLQRPSKEAKAELRANNETMSLMRLCDAKGCWMKDLDDVPGWELPYWSAYYELLDKERKREEVRARGRSR